MLNTTPSAGAVRGRGTAGSGTSLGRPGRVPPGASPPRWRKPQPQTKASSSLASAVGRAPALQRRTALVELNVGCACRSCAAVSRHRAQARVSGGAGETRLPGVPPPRGSQLENTAGLCQSPQNEHVQSLDFDLEPPGHIICVLGLVSNVATPAA